MKLKLIFCPIILVVMLSSLWGCYNGVEKDAVSGLQGEWVIDTLTSFVKSDWDARNTKVACGDRLVYSGSFSLKDDQSGSIKIIATHCDTTYVMLERNFTDLDLDYPGGEGLDKDFHRYWGNWSESGGVLQFQCFAGNGSDRLLETSNRINLFLSIKHDGGKDLNTLEEFDIDIDLDRR